MDIARKEPEKIICGDSVTWIRSLADFPAPVWSLAYTLVSQTLGLAGITINSSDDGQDHLLRITSAQTSALVPGLYRLLGRALDDSGNVITFFQSSLDIQADPATVATSVQGDTRTKAQRILANILSVIEDRSKGVVTSHSNDGLNLVFKSDTELEQMRQVWQSRVNNELAQERRNNGQRGGQRIVSRYTRPS